VVMLCGRVDAQPVPPARNDYAINFVPFGAGQFRNCQPSKGWAFATGQAVTGLTSFGLFMYLLGKYSFQNDRVPVEEATTVRRLQQLEVGTGLAFFGLYTWGVIDSVIHYRPEGCGGRVSDRAKAPRSIVVAPTGLSFAW
jgi:hypothetical protein